MKLTSALKLSLAILAVVILLNAGRVGYIVFLGMATYAVLWLGYSIVTAYIRHESGGKQTQKNFALKQTARFMGLFFFSGTMLYALAFPTITQDQTAQGNTAIFNNTELIIRSMVSSLDLFMLDVDSNVLDRLDRAPMLKGAIATQAAMSFCCTIALLISLIYSRAKAYIRLHHLTKISSERCHLYLFFGMDEGARMLAADIKRHDRGAIAVFVDHANINEDENDSWTNIVSLFAHKQKAFDIAENTGALMAIASQQLCDIDDNRLTGEETQDVLAIAGLGKIKRLIESLVKHPHKAELHLFFLSDREDDNIRSLIQLAKDKTILEIAENEYIKEKIYCHARLNGPNRVVEDLAVRKGLDVEIVDSSHLAVELLKSTPECQPVMVARLSKEYPATVEAPVKALIAGFGEVGRDAFRFIYEFGSFIRINKETGDAERCLPDITAIDAEMDKLKGSFIANTPAIKIGEGRDLLQVDCGSTEFYARCLNKEACETLNYVVVALGDDDLNISLACNIFNQIRRYRKDMSRLLILIRCLDGKKVEMMQKIADFYNNGSDGGAYETMRLFGKPDEIYSYTTIIRVRLREMGMTFHDNYRHLRDDGSPDWKMRRRILTGAIDRNPGQPIVPNMDKLRKLRRQESQDLANALHAATKIKLLEDALGSMDEMELFKQRVFTADMKSTLAGRFETLRYPQLTDCENKIMLMLAQTEHARWMAAHELMGYTENTETAMCDERSRRHNCLVAWSALNHASQKATTPDFTCDYKAYDFSVVETSLATLGN